MTAKRLATVGIFAVVAVIGVAEFFVGKEAWSIITHSNIAHTLGCACDVPAISGWQKWSILGLAGLFGVGVIAGSLYFVSTIIKTRRFIKRIRHGAENSTHNGAAILKFKNGPCETFTFGFFRTRIAVCAHCAESIASPEFSAMIEHEQHHMRNRDPLKFLLVDSLKYLFFFVPLIYSLVSWYHIAAELQADEQVLNRDALGSALLKVAGSRFDRTALIGASFASMLSVRIERIANPTRAVSLPLNRIAILGSLLLISGAVGVVGNLPKAHAGSSAQCMRPIVSCRMSPTIDAQTATYYNL